MNKINKLIWVAIIIILNLNCSQKDEYVGREIDPSCLNCALSDSLVKYIYLAIGDSIQIEKELIPINRISIWNQGEIGSYTGKYGLRISFDEISKDIFRSHRELQLRHKNKLLEFNGVFYLKSDYEFEEDTLFIEVLGRKDRTLNNSWWIESNLTPLDTLVVPLKNKLVIDWFEGNYDCEMDKKD